MAFRSGQSNGPTDSSPSHSAWLRSIALREGNAEYPVVALVYPRTHGKLVSAALSTDRGLADLEGNLEGFGGWLTKKKDCGLHEVCNHPFSRVDVILVRLARAIASRPRLRVLSWLAQRGPTVPTVLSRELKLSLPSLSTHLKVLSSVGLIQGRRSAARCHYAFDSPYGEHTLSGGMSRWLKTLLKDVTSDTQSKTGNPSESALHTVIFQAATAFTDLRRLRILRHLDRQGEATVEALVERLRMSRFAAKRHTAKLCRRGLLVALSQGQGQRIFRLAAQLEPGVVTEMHQIVRATWRNETVRTS